MVDEGSAPADAGATIRAMSGRPADDLTLDALTTGVLGPDDIRISAGALRAQAERAERAGYRPFAENLQRAAELVALPDSDVLAIYEALRPLRSAADDLEQVAMRLERSRAPRCAALVREAAEAYAARGLLQAAAPPSPGNDPTR